MQAAKAAGIPSVAVQFGYSNYEELLALGASHSIADFTELQALLADLT